VSNIPKWYISDQDRKFKHMKLKQKRDLLDFYVTCECNTNLGKKVGEWAIKCIENELGRLRPINAEIL
jgi:hypothetical protein